MTLTIDDVTALRANCDDYVATCTEALKYLINQLLLKNIEPIEKQSTKLLVRLYTIAKKCGIGYFNYNIMLLDY